MNQILDLHLKLGEYGVPDSQIACDGTDTIDVNKVRMEMIVDVVASPSEHWTTRITIQHDQRRSVAPWELVYSHQNVGPDNPRNGNNFGQLSQNVGPGRWVFTVKLIGLESGVVLVRSCSFMVISTNG